VGLAGKLKTGLKSKFGPVEHDQGPLSRTRRRGRGGRRIMRRGEEEDQQQEDQQQEQGRRTGVCIGNTREKRKMRSSGADKTINRNFD
jgi:hypothetical protein